MVDTPVLDPKDIVIEQLQSRIEELEKAGNELREYAEAYTRCLLADTENDTAPEYPPDSGEADAAIERWAALAQEKPCPHCGATPCLGEFDASDCLHAMGAQEEPG